MFEFKKLDIELNRELIIDFRIDSFLVSFGHARTLTEGSGIDDYLKNLKQRSDSLPGSCVHVLHESRIVGQIESRIKEAADQSREGYINLYYMVSEYRNQGLGRHLDKYMSRFYSNIGLSTLSLNVSQTNSGAIKFYEKMGYKIADRIEKSGEKIYVMSKMI